jgi:hypothetical protein
MDFNALLIQRRWELESFRPQPVMERVWPLLARLAPRSLDRAGGEDVTGFQDIRTPTFEGSLFAFSADKLEKLAVGYMCFMRRMVVFFIMAYPSDEYDFPVLGSDHTEAADHAGLILNLHALADLVVAPAYRERYLDRLDATWKAYQDLDNQLNPAAWYRALLSPFDINGRYPITGGDRAPAARALDCLCKYLDYYVSELVQHARPVTDQGTRQYAVARREAIKTVYREKDPGLGPLAAVLGAEAARKWAKLVY